MEININNKTTKDLIKDYREKLSKRGYGSRYDYIAYAFLRSKKYRTYERFVNEDKLPENGRDTFFTGLSYYVASNIADKIFKRDTKEWLEFRKSILPELLSYLKEPLEDMAIVEVA